MSPYETGLWPLNRCLGRTLTDLAINQYTRPINIRHSTDLSISVLVVDSGINIYYVVLILCLQLGFPEKRKVKIISEELGYNKVRLLMLMLERGLLTFFLVVNRAYCCFAFSFWILVYLSMRSRVFLCI